jgi:hypothetical protein
MQSVLGVMPSKPQKNQLVSKNRFESFRDYSQQLYRNHTYELSNNSKLNQENTLEVSDSLKR